jgi:TolB-like protein/Tfp pilus assembly protein PilF
LQCPDGSPPPCPGRAGPARSTVAVLPFDNLSRDTADAYLARDLTEEITNRLVKLERLTVTSATVMRRYRGSDNPRAVAQTLHVAYLVSGSVRRDRDRLRIAVELLRASDGVSPWTDVFDRRDTSLLDIQIQIAQSVASAITGRLLPLEQRQVTARPTRNPRAYDHVARGRFELNRRTARSLQRAAQEFETAMRLDSTFGAAIAGASWAYALLSGIYYDSSVVSDSRGQLLARAQSLAARALRTDSTSAEAWAATAMLAGPREQRAMLEHAMALSPHDADLLHLYAGVLGSTGDTAGARAMMLRAVGEDPTRSVSLLSLGMQAFYERRYAEAQRWLDSAIVFRPEAHFFYSDRAMARLGTGDTATVVADAAEVRRLEHPVVADAVLLLLSVARRDSAAVQAGAAALRAAAAPLNCNLNYDCVQAAMALAGAGNGDAALELLERATPNAAWKWQFLGVAEFDALRSDPRFQRMVTESKPSWAR